MASNYPPTRRNPGTPLPFANVETGQGSTARIPAADEAVWDDPNAPEPTPTYNPATDPTSLNFANVKRRGSSTAPDQQAPQPKELDLLIDDPDFLQIDDKEAYALFDAVAARDEDYVNAFPEEQEALARFAVVDRRRAKRAELAAANAPLTGALYEPGIKEDIIQPMQVNARAQTDAIDAVTSGPGTESAGDAVNRVLQNVGAGLNQKMPYLDTSGSTVDALQRMPGQVAERFEQGIDLALEGSADARRLVTDRFAARQMAPEDIGSAAAGLGKSFIGGAMQVGAPTAPVGEIAAEQARAGGMGPVASMVYQGLAEGGAGMAIGGMLPKGSVARQFIDETIGLGDRGTGVGAAKARVIHEPLDDTFAKIQKMDAAEEAYQRSINRKAAAAAYEAGNVDRAAAGVLQTPQGPVKLAPQVAPQRAYEATEAAGFPAERAGGVLRRPEGDVPLQAPREAPVPGPVEGDVYIPPQSAPPVRSVAAPIISEAAPEPRLLEAGGQGVMRGSGGRGDLALPTPEPPPAPKTPVAEVAEEAKAPLQLTKEQLDKVTLSPSLHEPPPPGMIRAYALVKRQTAKTKRTGRLPRGTDVYTDLDEAMRNRRIGDNYTDEVIPVNIVDTNPPKWEDFDDAVGPLQGSGRRAQQLEAGLRLFRESLSPDDRARHADWIIDEDRDALEGFINDLNYPQVDDAVHELREYVRQTLGDRFRAYRSGTVYGHYTSVTPKWGTANSFSRKYKTHPSEFLVSADDIVAGGTDQELELIVRTDGLKYRGPAMSPASKQPFVTTAEADPAYGKVLTTGREVQAELARKRPDWLQKLADEAQTELRASIEKIKNERGSAPDAIEGTRNMGRLAVIGAGVLWDLGAQGGQNFGRFRKAMQQYYPDFQPKDWHELYAKSRQALASARFRMTAKEFEEWERKGDQMALAGEGVPKDWYREGMPEVAALIDQLPKTTKIDNRKLQAMLHAGYSPQTSVKQAVIFQLDATEDLIRGQRLGKAYSDRMRGAMTDVGGEGAVPNLPREAARGEFPSEPPKVGAFAPTLERGLKDTLTTAQADTGPGRIRTTTDRHTGAMLFDEATLVGEGDNKKLAKVLIGKTKDGKLKWAPAGFTGRVSQHEFSDAAVNAMARRKGLGVDQLQAGTWVPYVQARTGNKASYQPWSRTVMEELEKRGGVEYYQKIALEDGVFDDMMRRLDDPNPDNRAFSYDVLDGRFIEVGGKDDKWIVSPYPERSAYLTPEQVSKGGLQEYMNANRDLLDRDTIRTVIDKKPVEIPIPRHVMGAWKGADGGYYLDVNIAVDRPETAEIIGKAYDQEGAFGTLKGEFKGTEGTGAGLDKPYMRTELMKRAREADELDKGTLRPEDFTEIREGRERDWLSKFKRRAERAEKRFKARLAETPLKNRRGSGSVYTDEDLKDLAIMGAYQATEAGMDFAKWSKAMIDAYPQLDLNEKILSKAWQGTKQYIKDVEEQGGANVFRSRPAPPPAPREVPSARGYKQEKMDVPPSFATRSMNEDVAKKIEQKWLASNNKWDKAAHPRIFDQIASDLADGKVDIGDWANILRDEGVSLEQFGHEVFKGTHSEAGRKLSNLARVTRELDKLMTEDEVVERALRNLDLIEKDLRKFDGIC